MMPGSMAAQPRAATRRLSWLGIGLWLLGALLAVVAPAAAQQQAAIPPLDGPVIDTTGTLDAATRQQLTQQALALQQRKGSQLQVLMVPTTAPETIEQYAVRAFEQYRIGRQRVDDAVLLVVAKDDRRVRIEVGYGLEGAIPDITAGRVVAEYMVPKFRQGDYAGGIVDATAQLIKLIDGEPLPEPMTRHGEGAGGGNVIFALVAAWVVALFVRGILGRTPTGVRGIATAAASGGTAWAISALLAVGGMGLVLGLILGLAVSGSGGGRYVRHSRVGSWGGGGFGGLGGSGGFGGGGGWSGGGGMSGGGGASGSW